MSKKVWFGLFGLVLVGLIGVAMMSVGVSVSGCAQSQSTTTTTLPSYATGTVSGVVLTSTGTPVASAVVNTFNGTTVLTGTTNSSGAYTISGVWIGVHVLLISSTNYYAVTSVAVTADTTTTQNISADAGTAATAAPTVTLTSVGTETARNSSRLPAV